MQYIRYLLLCKNHPKIYQVKTPTALFIHDSVSQQFRLGSAGTAFSAPHGTTACSLVFLQSVTSSHLAVGRGRSTELATCGTSSRRLAWARSPDDGFRVIIRRGQAPVCKHFLSLCWPYSYYYPVDLSKSYN